MDVTTWAVRGTVALSLLPPNPHSAGRPPRVRPWAAYGRRPSARTHDLRRPPSVTLHLNLIGQAWLGGATYSGVRSKDDERVEHRREDTPDRRDAKYPGGMAPHPLRSLFQGDCTACLAFILERTSPAMTRLGPVVAPAPADEGPTPCVRARRRSRRLGGAGQSDRCLAAALAANRGHAEPRPCVVGDQRARDDQLTTPVRRPGPPRRRGSVS